MHLTVLLIGNRLKLQQVTPLGHLLGPITPEVPSQPPLAGWFSYRAAIPQISGHAKTYVLSSEGAKNPGGKGITYNLESASYGTWKGGGLDVYLGDVGYPELYVRFYAKYDPSTFHWGTIVPNFGKQKMARISRLKIPPSLTDNPQIFLGTDPGNQTPTFYPDWFNNPAYNTPPSINPIHFDGLHVFDPGAGNAIEDDQWQIPWPSDGQWHCYEYRVKMNDTPGVATGGEWEFWIDGQVDTGHHKLATGLAWVGSTGSTAPGWNWVTVLDNASIQPDSAFTNAVMKIFMDDVVISTHYSGPPPSPTSVTVQSTTAATAQLSWTAGTSTVQYFLSGYRVYYGTSPNSLGQSVTLGTNLNTTINGLTSGQTYYFKVTAVNLATYDVDENESLPSEVVSVLVN